MKCNGHHLFNPQKHTICRTELYTSQGRSRKAVELPFDTFLKGHVDQTIALVVCLEIRKMTQDQLFNTYLHTYSVATTLPVIPNSLGLGILGETWRGQ